MSKKRIWISFAIEAAVAVIFGLVYLGLSLLDFIRLPEMIATILLLITMTAGVLAVSSLVKGILMVWPAKTHRARTMVTISASLCNYAAALIILCWGLSILGVNIGTIVASVGILALVVGFGAETLIEDVITGMFMIFENQYNVGDIVEVNGFRGTVSVIGIRTTCIMDNGGNVKIINNSDMKNLLNKSDNSSKALCDFHIPYDTDLLKLEEQIPGILEEIYKRYENTDVMSAKPHYLGVQELGSSAIVLRFVAEVPEKSIYSTARVLNHDLYIEFKKLGITCPYKQVDVHNC